MRLPLDRTRPGTCRHRAAGADLICLPDRNTITKGLAYRIAFSEVAPDAGAEGDQPSSRDRHGDFVSAKRSVGNVSRRTKRCFNAKEGCHLSRLQRQGAQEEAYQGRRAALYQEGPTSDLGHRRPRRMDGGRQAPFHGRGGRRVNPLGPWRYDGIRRDSKDGNCRCKEGAEDKRVQTCSRHTGSMTSRVAAFWRKAERVIPRILAASSSVSRNPFSRLRFTRTTLFRSRT